MRVFTKKIKRPRLGRLLGVLAGSGKASAKAVWAALVEEGVWEEHAGLCSNFLEVTSSRKGKGITPEEASFLGDHTLATGLTYRGFRLTGGRNLVPFYAAVYWVENIFGVYVPREGNPYNTRTARPYGEDLAVDAENITCRVMSGELSLDSGGLLEHYDDDDDDDSPERGLELVMDVRADIGAMLEELESQVVYLERKEETQGQVLEFPKAEVILRILRKSSLDEGLRSSIVAGIEASPDDYLDWGSLICAYETARAYIDAHEKEGGSELGVIREHIKEVLPDDFPFPIRTERGDVLFKNGGDDEDAVSSDSVVSSDSFVSSDVEEFLRGFEDLPLGECCGRESELAEEMARLSGFLNRGLRILAMLSGSLKRKGGEHMSMEKSPLFKERATGLGDVPTVLSGLNEEGV